MPGPFPLPIGTGWQATDTIGSPTRSSNTPFFWRWKNRAVPRRAPAGSRSTFSSGAAARRPGSCRYSSNRTRWANMSLTTPGRTPSSARVGGIIPSFSRRSRSPRPPRPSCSQPMMASTHERRCSAPQKRWPSGWAPPRFTRPSSRKRRKFSRANPAGWSATTHSSTGQMTGSAPSTISLRHCNRASARPSVASAAMRWRTGCRWIGSPAATSPNPIGTRFSSSTWIRVRANGAGPISTESSSRAYPRRWPTASCWCWQETARTTSPGRSISSEAIRSTGATGARSATCRSFTSRCATTRPSSSRSRRA